MHFSLSTVRQRLERWRLFPLSRLARVFWRDLALAVALNWIANLLHGGLLGGTARVFSVIGYIVAVPCGVWLAARWIKNGVLWRLRNRLIVTYFFIGAAPIFLLLTLAFICAYVLSGQFAALVAIRGLQEEQRQVAIENRAIAEHLRGDGRAGRLDLAHVPELNIPPTDSHRAVALFEGYGRPISQVSTQEAFSRPPWLRDDFEGIVRDNGRMFIRAARSFDAGGHHYTVISSEQLDERTLARASNDLGRVGIFGDIIGSPAENGGRERRRSKAARNVGHGEEEGQSVEIGTVPASKGAFDRTLYFTSPLEAVRWIAGEHVTQQLFVFTRPSILYNKLFSANADWAGQVRSALIAVTVIFGFIEIFALFIGMRLTRSITEAVYELYNATLHIERGNLNHRIRVHSNDQLAALEGSFNTMAASLDRLLAEQREKERMQNELVIAQEVQEQLFPRGWKNPRYLDLFGVCRPARTVSGDYYDFLSFGSTCTGVAVGDISGKGISAALLMATIQSAVRSFQFTSEPEVHALAANPSSAPSSLSTQALGCYRPSEAMWQLNRHLFHSTPPEKYATMFFGIYDSETRRLTYTNAGHLPPLIIRNDGSVERLTVSGTVIGLFEHMSWEQSTIQLAPGDIFFSYSDGLTEPENEFGEFGEERVIALLQQHRKLPIEEIARLTISAVEEWIGEREQPDDITVVLARATA
jgi:sigma-B regulation protein RsbU (phosphoserine phosphatase)